MRNVEHYVPPPDQGLDILHLDDDIIVVVKPSGLLSVPGRGADKADCMFARLHNRYPGTLIVHRLDMETSGVMVFARHYAAQRSLSILFQMREMKKSYIAIVTGKPAAAQGVVDLPLRADWALRPLQKVDPAGKPSTTRYLSLDYDPRTDRARMALIPVTGRSHQLRVHMLSLGHPIIGDRLYAPHSVATQAERLLLHAEQLHFVHPVSKKPLSFISFAPF